MASVVGVCTDIRTINGRYTTLRQKLEAMIPGSCQRFVRIFRSASPTYTPSGILPVDSFITTLAAEALLLDIITK
jgi:hypothetical protein